MMVVGALVCSDQRVDVIALNGNLLDLNEEFFCKALSDLVDQLKVARGAKAAAHRFWGYRSLVKEVRL